MAQECKVGTNLYSNLVGQQEDHPSYTSDNHGKGYHQIVLDFAYIPSLLSVRIRYHFFKRIFAAQKYE